MIFCIIVRIDNKMDEVHNLNKIKLVLPIVKNKTNNKWSGQWKKRRY